MINYRTWDNLPLQVEIVEDWTDKYICEALPWTFKSDSKWRITKIDEDGMVTFPVVDNELRYNFELPITDVTSYDYFDFETPYPPSEVVVEII